MKNLLCPHCAKELSRPCSFTIHVYSCKLNPERKPHKSGYKPGHKPSNEVCAKIAASGMGRVTSDRTKAKISASRIKFLDENPHMVPYVLNHKAHGESYPEKYWRQILTQSGIHFKQEHRVSRYQIDFAIGSIALEIDGEQHYNDKRIVLSDIRRNETLNALGWKTIRVRWASYQKMSEQDKAQYRISLLEKLKQQS